MNFFHTKAIHSAMGARDTKALVTLVEAYDKAAVWSDYYAYLESIYGQPETINRSFLRAVECYHKNRGSGGITGQCCNCGAIKAQEGEWVYLDLPIRPEFSHGICPPCVSEIYPELADELGQRK